RPALRQHLEFIQQIRSIEEQALFYRRHIAPELWTPTLRWLLNRSAILNFLGVPVDQIRQMRGTGIRSLGEFVERRVERMFTTTPISENYFWRVYIDGHYTPESCPSYLRSENFEELKRLSPRIHVHTMSLTKFLQCRAGRFSIFVLLDHMDW